MFIPSTTDGSGVESNLLVAASGAGAVWQRARFGTVRPRVQIPRPRPVFHTQIARNRTTGEAADSQPTHAFLSTSGLPPADVGAEYLLEAGTNASSQSPHPRHHCDACL
jgi:hypothetical protein